MSRINTNVSALIARQHLQRSNADLNTSLERLSTGLKINRGADDPAGLIVSERLRTEIAGIDQAIDNVERASNVIATTEGALQEINDLLVSIKGLTIEAANTGAFSKEEIEANQLQIDSAIESITRISNSASFAGLKLLNGSLDYILSGVDATELTDVRVFSADFGSNSGIPVSVEVLDAPERAELFISGGGATPAFTSSFTFEIRGPVGVEVVRVTSGVTYADVVSQINSKTTATGVSAATFNTSGIVLNSTEFGSDAFVSVEVLGGGGLALDALDGNFANRDEGVDTLALINGNLALGDGLDISLNSSTLNVEMTLTEAASQALNTPYSFGISGGGATYQIGPSVNNQQQVFVGIQSVAATRLGNSQAGFLSEIVSGGSRSLIAGRAADAGNVIDVAIDQVTKMRGRLGALERNTLQTTLRSNQTALENITAAESVIRDTDFAEETSRLTRAQVLQQAGTSTLALANSTSQSVLALLGG